MASVTDNNDFDEKTKTAANYLTKAAGIFNYIHETELSKWSVKPQVFMAEAKDETFVALAT